MYIMYVGPDPLLQPVYYAVVYGLCDAIVV